jgi:hypothetical protein
MGLACLPPGYVVFVKHTLPQVAHAFPSFFKIVQSPESLIEIDSYWSSEENLAALIL